MWSFEDTNWEIVFTYQLKIHFDKKPIEILILEIFEMVVQSFCFGLNIFSPLALSAKNRELESPFYIFSPFGA
jgi:hypothetical protein